jgi:hypothetical protein
MHGNEGCLELVADGDTERFTNSISMFDVTWTSCGRALRVREYWGIR